MRLWPVLGALLLCACGPALLTHQEQRPDSGLEAVRLGRVGPVAVAVTRLHATPSGVWLDLEFSETVSEIEARLEGDGVDPIEAARASTDPGFVPKGSVCFASKQVPRNARLRLRARLGGVWHEGDLELVRDTGDPRRALREQGIEEAALIPTWRSIRERDGILVWMAGTTPVAVYRREWGSRPLLAAADHLHAGFVVRNDRAGQVTVSTKEARLHLAGREFAAAGSVDLVLGPGETRAVDVRFDGSFFDHPEGVHPSPGDWIRWAEVRFEDGGRLELKTSVQVGTTDFGPRY